MNEEQNNGDFSPDDQEIAPITEMVNTPSEEKPARRGKNLGLWITTILLLTVGGGLGYGWFFIQKKLAPQVETSLTNAFARPIKLGDVQQFTLNGLQFGATEVPATPKDPDKVTIEGIKVDFDPLMLITNRTLKLDLTLIKPDIYLEQNEKKEWISTKIIKKEGPIKIDLQRVKVEDAEVILVPREKDGKLGAKVPLVIKTGNVALSNGNQQILLNLNGNFTPQDDFKVNVKTNLTAKDYQISLNTKNLEISQLTKFVNLPLKIEQGKLNSSLEIVGKNKQISALTGVVQIEALKAIIPQLPQPLTETNLEVKFRGKEGKIVTFTTLFGQIPTIASGMIDLEKGWNVTAATDFNLKDLFSTLKLKKLPVNLTGGLNVVAQITGPLNNPIIQANIKNNLPVKVDKVGVKEVQSSAIITKEKIILNNIKITPNVGGNITGKGELKLTDKKEVKIDLNASEIPAGAIALLYQPKFPIPMGKLNGKGSITGTLNKPQDLVFNGQANVQIANGLINLNQLKIGQGKWSSELEAKGLQAEQLLTRIEQKVPQGVINGKFQVGGSLKDLGIKAITLEGTGKLSTDSGNLDLSNLTLNNGQLEAKLNAVNVNVNSLLSLSRPLAYQEPINGQFSIRSNLNNKANIDFNGIAKVAGGSVRIEGKLVDQELTGTIYTANLKTNNVSPRLPDALLSSNFNFTGSLNNLNIAGITADGQGKLQLAGGTIIIDGIVNSGEFIGTVNTTGIQLNKLLPQIPSGVFNSKFKLQSNLTNLTPDKLTAKAQGEINLGGGKVTVNTNIQEGQLIAQVETNQVQVNSILPEIPRGKLNSQVVLETALADFNIANIRAMGKANLIGLGGEINVNNMALNNGQLQGEITAQGLDLEQIPKIPAPLTGELGGNFQVAGNVNNLSPNTVLAAGNGQVKIADGLITASNIVLNEGNFQADLKAEDLNMEKLPKIPSQLTEIGGKIGGNFQVAGNVENLTPNGFLAAGEGKVTLADGLITANNIVLNEGNFQADLTSEGVKLAEFSPELTGDLNAQLRVNGNINNLKPAAINAMGQLNLTEGIPPLPEAIIASVNWDGKVLNTKTSAGDRLNLVGFAELDLAKKGINAVENVNFEVKAQEIDLAKLPLPLPENLTKTLAPNNEKIVTGQASFDGKIIGKIRKPNINGDLSLANLTLPLVNIENLLEGSVNMNSQGEVNFNLTGENDQIQLALGKNYQPNNFLVKLDNLEVTGGLEKDTLKIASNNIPLELIKNAALVYSLPLNPTLLQTSETAFVPEKMRGNFSGNLNINWPSLTAKKPWPLFNAEATLTDLDVQQLLIAGQFFDVLDFQRGLAQPKFSDSNSLYPTDNNSSPLLSVNTSELNLGDQLNRVSEISAFLANQKRQQRENSSLPPLQDLEGKFNLSLTASNTEESGLLAGLNLQNVSADQPWRWGPYTAQKVALSSRFEEGVLSIDPLRVELGDSVLELTSTWGEKPTADLKLENISVDLVDNFVKIPTFVNFGGGINANVKFSDFPTNLQAIGAVRIKDATINQTPIQAANGSFTYQDSRLDFLFSSLLSEKADPLTIIGTFPLQLPRGQKPDSDDLLLNVSVKDQGMSIINLLSRNQVNWIDGQGDVQIEITGKYLQGAGGLSQLRAEGEAIVENATITALALPDEPLTDVQGKMTFDFDQVEVTDLKGKLGEGDVYANGTLALSRPLSQEKPLTVDLNNLKINLKTLYRGGVDGNVLVVGSALEPTLRGNLQLSNGQVFLPEQNGGGNIGNNRGFDVNFENLQLNLGNNIQITKPPLLNFLAKGDLDLTGTKRQPILEGEIDLLRGQVNLFTTQFLLQGGYDNRAVFIPSQGLDPNLDVLLKTSTTETTRQFIPTDPLSAEIADQPQSEVGGLQTIRIEAKVQGPASQITENISLTSSPQRNESEIVGLLGGRFIDTFEGGDTTMGLANLASSALLGNIQNWIGNALGLSEFRLYPTTIREEFRENSSNESSTNFGLGAEVGVDIGRNFSFSVLKVINTPQPFQYGMRYRLNDNLLFRGSTDLFGDSKGTFEYGIRF